MPPVWFERKAEKSGFVGIVKPVKWQGWVVHIAMVFGLAMLAQMIGGWALLNNFKPIGVGIWLVAGVFILLGVYFRVVSMFSGPRE